MTDIHLRTADHPRANGRTPIHGDKGYVMTFLLEDGSRLHLGCGDELLDQFIDRARQLILARLEAQAVNESRDGGGA